MVPGYRACVMDDEGRPAPPGTVGKLAVIGPTGCKYMDDERQAAYVKGGWNHPGDAFVQDADGYLFLCDRKIDMIISGGVNIYPQEAENVLITHPAVMDVAVFGVPHEKWGETPVAAIVLRETDSVGADELREFVGEGQDTARLGADDGDAGLGVGREDRVIHPFRHRGFV